jgi:hypothetical protein
MRPRRVVPLLIGLAFFGVGSAAAAQPGEAEPVPTAELSVEYRPAAEIQVTPLIDELAPGTVLVVRALGFEADTTGSVRQCVEGRGRRCENLQSVRFDEKGAASFQYLVTDEVAAAEGPDERCRLGQARCTIELRSGRRVMAVESVFVDAAPPVARLTVTGVAGTGGSVDVLVEGLPPAVPLSVTVCAAPATSGPRCGAPGPEVAVTSGADGTARLELALDGAVVGEDRVACGRRVRCTVVATSPDAGVRVVPATLGFAAAPGAGYDPTRVIVGLAAAAVLLLAAAWLVTITDWRPPREADASSIDEADYADLDAEAARYEASGVRSA